MKYLKQIAGHAVSLAFIIYLFFQLDLQKLSDISHSINWEFFFAAIFINCISYFAHALRWKLFFNEPGLTISNIFRAVAIGHMFNAILPSKSGELIRPAFLRRIANIPYLDALATCMVERILDVAIVLLCLLLGLWHYGSMPFATEAAQAALGLGAFGALFLSILYFQRRPVVNILERALPVKAAKVLVVKLDQLGKGVKRIKNKQILGSIVGYSLLYWILNVGAIWLLLFSLNLDPELQQFMTAVLIVGALGLALSMPSAPANVGVYHYTIYYILSSVTESSEGTLGNATLFVAASILIHLAALVPDLFIGAGSYYSFPRPSNPQERSFDQHS